MERDGELALLGDALGRAASGRGGLVVINGPAGIGKSALLAAARELGNDHDMAVLGARGTELERALPYGAALQLFEPPLRAATPAERDELFAGAAGLAYPLFRGAGGGTSRTDDASSLIHGLHWLAANLSEAAPLLIVIDDAHWADRASLRFLLYLSQRLEDLPVAILATSRPGEPGAPDDLLLELADHPLARVARPAALSPGAVEQLVRARFSRAEEPFSRAVARVTEGNPFLVTELLGALSADGVAPTAASAAQVEALTPESVVRAVLLRLPRLPPGTAALARAVAVLGADAHLRHAAALAELDAEVAGAAADALAAADILCPTEPLSFVHPLLRSAIYGEVPVTQCARLHRRAAGQLDAEGASADRVAAHLVLARPAAEPWTVDVLRRAADRAVSEGAPESAAHLLRRALAEPPAAEHTASVLVALGRAEAAAGQLGAAQRFAAALELEREPGARADIALQLGRALYTAGAGEQAAESFERGLAELGELPELGDRPQAEHHADDALASELRAAWVTVARTEVALRPAAVRHLAAIIDRPAAATTHAERVLLAQVAGERTFAGEPCAETIAIARRALKGDALVIDGGSDDITWLGAVGALGWSDDLDEYERVALAGLAEARRRGSVTRFADASYALNYAHYFQGRLADAVADAEQAIDAERYGWNRFSLAARAQLAWALVERDELTRADDALDVPDRHPPWAGSSMRALVLDARARVHIARGELEAAEDALREAGSVFCAALVVNPACLDWKSRLALVVSRLGRTDEALSLVGEELELVRRFGAPRPLGVALRVAGLIEGGARGIDRLEESVATLARSPSALEHGRALVDLGAALRRHGKRQAARDPLQRGLEMARRFGARALERQALEELRVAGGRPRRTQLNGVDGLTPGERRVAAMAADGMSNAEIAQALFVTVAAVKWHLRHAYQKLDITSRRELGQALRAGQAPPPS